MLERSERTLKIACLCLLALLTYQVARLVVRKDPLAQLNIPALPAWSSPTNSSSGRAQTNAPSLPSLAKPGTNSPAPQDPTRKATNALRTQDLGQTQTNQTQTNLPPAQASTQPQTNAPTPGLSAQASPQLQTNAPRPGMPARTEIQTNSRPAIASIRSSAGSRSGSVGPPLPAAIQARIDRIIESELLAPIIRPMPMALLGIAGDDAILRAPNGQTGLLKEGAELGGIKLLRIGINRVLVEQDGQKKELMIFAGFGGESLLPNEKENPK